MSTAFKPANILVPNEKNDMSSWSVVACDQYTSEPEYWEDVKEIVGDKVSSLNMILPEVYLESDDIDSKITNIHSTMNEYLSSDVFEEYKDSYIYFERTLSDG